jgi:hypothetical protein
VGSCVISARLGASDAAPTSPMAFHKRSSDVSGNLSGAELGEPRNAHTKQAVLIAKQTHHASGSDKPSSRYLPINPCTHAPQLLWVPPAIPQARLSRCVMRPSAQTPSTHILFAS